jgi:hypothetical protein
MSSKTTNTYYAKIKIPCTSLVAKSTQSKVHNLRIKDEIKYLYLKKQQLNSQIYQLHLSLANTWGSTWQYIQSTIEEKLKKIIQSKYKNLKSFFKKVILLINNTLVVFDLLLLLLLLLL